MEAWSQPPRCAGALPSLPASLLLPAPVPPSVSPGLHLFAFLSPGLSFLSVSVCAHLSSPPICIRLSASLLTLALTPIHRCPAPSSVSCILLPPAAFCPRICHCSHRSVSTRPPPSGIFSGAGASAPQPAPCPAASPPPSLSLSPLSRCTLFARQAQPQPQPGLWAPGSQPEPAPAPGRRNQSFH